MTGSGHYVRQLTDEELDAIKVMINFDSVGSGTFLRGPGDSRLTSLVEEIASKEGVSYTNINEGYSGSDHFSFRYDTEIPIIGFYSNDKSRINTRSDTIEFINPVLLGDMVVLVLELLASLEDL